MTGAVQDASQPQEDAGKFGAGSAGTQASWELAVHEGKQMEGLKLVSRQFRKQRLALWAASQLQEDAGKLGAGSAGRKANGRFEASF